MNRSASRLRRAGAALVAACALQASLADEPAFDAAFAQLQLALDGDGGAVARAADRFGALVRDNPADPVLLAYAGAATALKARAALLPWRKLSHAEDGLAQLDRALALLQPAHDRTLHRGVPATLQTRFVAANTFLGMPGFFNRGARGAKLLDDVVQSPLLATAPLPFRGAVWLRAGRQAAQAKNPQEARRWFGEVVQHGAPQADEARALLKELP